jgi:hypothetical protein
MCAPIGDGAAALVCSKDYLAALMRSAVLHRNQKWGDSG